MHERFAKRIEARLESSAGASSAPAGRWTARPIERQIGRLLGQQHAAPRAATRSSWSTTPTRGRSLRLDWSVHGRVGRVGPPQRGLLRAAHQHHRLDARGAVADLHPAHRGRGRLPHPQERPVDPTRSGIRRPSASQAHILVCFLAYVLWKTLEQWQERAGLGNSPRTILDELGRIQSTDVVLPLADETHARAAHPLRRPPRSSAQAMLLDRLGLTAPRATPPPADRSRNVVPTRAPKYLENQETDPTTAEVGLAAPDALGMPSALTHSRRICDDDTRP